MLNYGRFFVEVLPEKLVIKHGNTEDLALTMLVVEQSHVAGFVSLLQQAQKDLNHRAIVQASDDIPLYIKRMCNTEFNELVTDVHDTTVSEVVAKWGIPEPVIEKLVELLS